MIEKSKQKLGKIDRVFLYKILPPLNFLLYNKIAGDYT